MEKNVRQEEVYDLESGVRTIKRPTENEALRLVEIDLWRIKNKFFVNKQDEKIIAVEHVLIKNFGHKPTATLNTLAGVFGISDSTCKKLLLLIDWKLDVDYQLTTYLF